MEEDGNLIIRHEILSAADRIPLPHPPLWWSDKEAPPGQGKPQVHGKEKRGVAGKGQKP